MTRRVVAALLGTALVTAVAGCSGSRSGAPTVTAAPGATDQACVTALAAAPATVMDKPRTPLPTAGALAWGAPPVVLRCGLPQPPPSTAVCLSVNGVDWLIDVSGDPFVFTSYGRAPAVELRVPAGYGRESAVAALTDVGPVAAKLPGTGRACIGAGDVAGSLSATPSDAATPAPAADPPAPGSSSRWPATSAGTSRAG